MQLLTKGEKSHSTVYILQLRLGITSDVLDSLGCGAKRGTEALLSGDGKGLVEREGGREVRETGRERK